MSIAAGRRRKLSNWLRSFCVFPSSNGLQRDATVFDRCHCIHIKFQIRRVHRSDVPRPNRSLRCLISKVSAIEIAAKKQDEMHVVAVGARSWLIFTASSLRRLFTFVKSPADFASISNGRSPALLYCHDDCINWNIDGPSFELHRHVQPEAECAGWHGIEFDLGGSCR